MIRHLQAEGRPPWKLYYLTRSAAHTAFLDELRARVRSVIAYLDGFSAKDFEGAATRSVTQPRWEGKTMSGADYFLEHALPNFFFHLSHTYALLRHNGVPIGKRDFMSTPVPA